MRNPQMFQMLEQSRKSNNNPKEILNQMLNNYKPEQINQFRQYAKSFGISDEQLNDYGISSK